MAAPGTGAAAGGCDRGRRRLRLLPVQRLLEGAAAGARWQPCVAATGCRSCALLLGAPCGGALDAVQPLLLDHWS